MKRIYLYYNVFNLFLNSKIVKLIEDIPKSSELDIALIDTMQKWDLNTGGARKVLSGTANLVLSTGLQVPMYERTFSMFTNRIYLEALLRRERYEPFFSTCLDLIFVKLLSCITLKSIDISRV